MAVCVMGRLLDTDVQPPAYVVACHVHCHYAPCPRNGEPASVVALEGIDGDEGGRDAALGRWALKTKQQRPFLLHHGTWTDDRLHDGGEACWCNPEQVAASIPALRDGGAE